MLGSSEIMITSELYPSFSRNFADEQGYADAAHTLKISSSPLDSTSITLAPSMRWKRTTRQQLDGNPCAVKTLVVAFQGSGVSFVKKCFDLQEAQWVGTVILCEAEPSPTGGDTLDPSDPLNASCNIFLKGDVAIALCGYKVFPKASHRWAAELLTHIMAETVVVYATIPGTGAGSVQVLATTAVEDKDGEKIKGGFPQLVTPILLTGAPAAVISYCQRRGLPAVCYVTVAGQGETNVATKAFASTVPALNTLTGGAVVTSEVTPSLDSGMDNDFQQRVSSLYL
ncbi:unnamed protein product [Choristocarpus tenellus]